MVRPQAESRRKLKGCAVLFRGLKSSKAVWGLCTSRRLHSQGGWLPEQTLPELQLVEGSSMNTVLRSTLSKGTAGTDKLWETQRHHCSNDGGRARSSLFSFRADCCSRLDSYNPGRRASADVADHRARSVAAIQLGKRVTRRKSLYRQQWPGSLSPADIQVELRDPFC